MNLVGYLLGNRYQILEKIGDGGMAEVYKAKCTLLNRYVAIKVLKEEYVNDAELSKKFTTEAQAAASLSHPNIVSIYDVGKDGNINYFVMELVEGKTLKDYITEKGKLHWKEACEIAYQISQGIEHAHKNHIIHRDIKPQNIVLTKDMKIKVTDFGIAKAVTATTMTISGDTMGSVHYFSPEQAKGGFTTEKSDIYSLGIVLYEMLTGVLPFNGETPVAIALKQVQDVAKNPSDIEITVPASVSNIVMKAMQKDPNLRYLNITDFALDLSLALNNPNGNYGVVKDYDNFATQKIEPVKFENNITIKKKNDLEEFVKNSREDSIIDTSKLEGRNNVKTSKRKKKKFRRVLVVILLGIILFGAMFYAGLYFTGALDRVPDVTLPDITTKNVEDAEAMLKEMGLTLIVASEVFDAEIPINCIISQDPVGPKSVKPGREVTVVVSKGPTTVLVPDIMGLPLDDAKFALEQRGLEYEVIEENSMIVDKGEIIKQSPEKNETVNGGSVINIYVSAGVGDGKVKMPKLTEKTEADVREIIANNNLVLKEPVVYKSNKEQPNNVVLTQSIPEGSVIPEGTEISIEVNKISVETTSPISNTDISYSEGVVTVDLSNMSASAVNIKVFNDSKRILIDNNYVKSDEKAIITIVDTTTEYIEVYVDNNIAARFSI